MQTSKKALTPKTLVYENNEISYRPYPLQYPERNSTIKPEIAILPALLLHEIPKKNFPI